MLEVIAGRYEILELIGRGGMGTVYKARQRTLDRIVAVKMLSEELASDIEFRARFQQEAAVLARLNHPAIVQIYDIEPHGDTFCIIMEYVHGETLQAVVNRLGALPEYRVLQIGAQVARGLGYAHGIGVVHRDVKPDNILIGENGLARIMDFGIAHVKGSSLKTQTGISMGTPRYMSPEQVTGRGVDGQADLYCLGLCLYFGLTGQPPFDGENPVEIATKQVYENPAPPSALFTAISPATDDAVMRSIAKQKEDRWPDGEAMAQGLEAVLNHREGHSRHSGLQAASQVSMTAVTPARVVLADSNTPAIPAGATRRQNLLPQIDGEVVVGDTPSSPRNPQISVATPVPGLVPLAPLHEGISDFESPASDQGEDGEAHKAGQPGRDPSRANELLVSSQGGESTQAELLAAEARSYRSWTNLGLIVAAVVVILVFAYNNINTTPQVPPPPTRGAQVVPSDEVIHGLERESVAASTNGRHLEIIKAWQKLIEEREPVNSRDPALIVAEDYIRWLRAQIDPLQATDELVRRRLDRAQSMLNARRPAIASAYTEKTVDLFGRGTLYNERVENLRRLIDRSLPNTLESTSSDLLDKARRLLDTQTTATGPLMTDAERRVENLYLDAVQASPTSFQTWVEAGRFYLMFQYFDDARVFFMVAADRAANGAERGTANQLLESLPSQ